MKKSIKGIIVSEYSLTIILLIYRVLIMKIANTKKRQHSNDLSESQMKQLQNKIIESQYAYDFFKHYATVYFIKGVGHILDG